MRTSQNNKLTSVLNNGRVVAIIEQDETRTARIYCNFESRGNRTGYNHKDFYYLIGFKNCIPVWIHGITRDSRRKGFINFWNEQKYNYRIIEQDLFEKLIA